MGRTCQQQQQQQTSSCVGDRLLANLGNVALLHIIEHNAVRPGSQEVLGDLDPADRAEVEVSVVVVVVTGVVEVCRVRSERTQGYRSRP